MGWKGSGLFFLCTRVCDCYLAVLFSGPALQLICVEKRDVHQITIPHSVSTRGVI